MPKRPLKVRELLKRLKPYGVKTMQRKRGKGSEIILIKPDPPGSNQGPQIPIKNLFSHSELIRDLLQGFIKEQWVKELDMDTLEKVNGSYVSDDLRERQDDIIWRVRLADSWIYVS